MIKTMSDYNFRLTIQWRMHPAIADVARALTYPYLKDGVTEKDRPFPEELPKKLRRNVGVLHAQYSTRQRGASWESKTEAEGAARLAGELTRSPPKGYRPQDITILTPYEAQLQLINSLLRRCGLLGVQTSTIEKAQGSESEVTIVSPVRTDTDFTTDKHRVNVATTRARTQLLIVTDTDRIKNTVSYGKLWRDGLLGKRFDL